MPPVQAEEFEALVQTLDHGAFARFVADVWAAGGWETAVEGGGSVVVAEADGTTERIRVVPEEGSGLWPGPVRRLLSRDATVDPDELSDVDVVVAARDDPALVTAADGASVEYLPPEALRDRLLYGVPRSAATDLFERHFDRDLMVREAGRSRAGEAPAGSGGSGSSIPSTRVAVAALLVVVAVAAAAVGPADVARRQAGPATEEFGPVAGSPSTTPSPSPTPDRYPPGLSADGVENLSVLADAHVTAVRNRQYTLDVVFAGPPEATGFENFSGLNWRLWVGSDHNYRINATYRHEDREPAWLRLGVYADGVTMYRRLATPNGTQYSGRPAEAADATAYLFFARSLLVRYLDTPATSVEKFVDEENGTVRYLVEATGTPGTLDNHAQGYRARAWVTPEGRVVSLAVEYSAKVGGTYRAVRVGFEYLTYEDSEVTAPPWLDEARNRTGG